MSSKKYTEKITFSVYAKDPNITHRIQSSMDSFIDSNYSFHPKFFNKVEAAVDYLTYGQINSRLFILEYSNNKKELAEIIKKIHFDPWLHGTIMVVITDSITHFEMEDLLNTGVIDFISSSDIKTKLPIIIKIVTSNYQLFESEQFSLEIHTIKTGTVVLKNKLPLVSKATSHLLNFCYAAGFRDLESYSKISMSLNEMITNAIEHGNCGIGYKRKTEILNKHMNIREHIEEIANLPENIHKRVKIKYQISNDKAVFIISDDGDGFNFREMPNPTKGDNMLLVHGRGIMIARNFSSKLEYSKKGNKLRMTFFNNSFHKKNSEMLLFGSEEMITLNPGEVLLEDMQESDYFYYILSGKLGVYINDKQVDIVHPEDMFVGELAFLHQNRRSGTVKALSPSRLLPISRHGFIDMIKKYPYTGVFLARMLAKRLVRRNEKERILSLNKKE